MEKKIFKLIIWSSIVLVFVLFPANYLLYDFDRDLFSNKILLPILFAYLFIIIFSYYMKIWRKKIKEKTVEKLNNLKVSLRAAKYVAIGMGILTWFFSVFIILVLLYGYFFHFELYDSPEINNLLYFGIMMGFCGFIWMFFTGLIFYEQSKVYSSLESKK